MRTIYFSEDKRVMAILEPGKELLILTTDQVDENLPEGDPEELPEDPIVGDVISEPRTKSERKAKKNVFKMVRKITGKKDVDDEKFGDLLRRIAEKKISCAEVAEKLGISVANFYYRQAKYQKRYGKVERSKDSFKLPPGAKVIDRKALATKFGNPTKKTQSTTTFSSGGGEKNEERSWEEIRDDVQRMQEDGKNSLQIAQHLNVSLREVNKYWTRDKDPEDIDGEDEASIDEDEVEKPAEEEVI